MEVMGEPGIWATALIRGPWGDLGQPESWAGQGVSVLQDLSCPIAIYTTV